ncbi:GIY-YIG nuclease family protein [Patescibacteria group bacterium]
MYCVYFIYSDKLNRAYIGQTANINKRLNAHNRGKVKSTRMGTPWRLLGIEEYSDRWMAMRREKYLKSLYGYKTRKRIVEELTKLKH